MAQINDEKIELAYFPDGIVDCLSLGSGLVMIGVPILDGLYKSSAGQYLKNNDYDCRELGLEFLFEDLIAYPDQIREGGAGALLVVRSSVEMVDHRIIPACYALRIAPAQDENGNRFYEVQDIDIHYNLKRHDRVLWEREESK